MNKPHKIFSIACGAAAIFAICLFFLLPDDLVMVFYPDVLSIIGYLFMIATVWMMVSIAVFIYKNTADKKRAWLWIPLAEAAFLVFIKLWFFH